MKLISLITTLSILSTLQGCIVPAKHSEPVSIQHYQVKYGDTPESISDQFKVSSSELTSLNHCDDPCLFRPGEIITIPPNHKVTTETKSSDSPLVHLSDKEFQRIVSEFGYPLDQMVLISKFGPRRGTFHEGIDLAAPRGTKVYAVHDGTIGISGTKMSGYGEMIVIKGNGYITNYAHLDEAIVKRGEHVQKGDVIGYVGATGDAEGPHLHFELRLRPAGRLDTETYYQAIDPEPFLRAIE